MKNLILDTLNTYPVQLTLVLFVITLTYFAMLYRWSKKANDTSDHQHDVSDLPTLSASMCGYLYHKCYKPRLFMSTLLDWHSKQVATLTVDNDLFFTLTPQVKDNDQCFKKLFKQHRPITFGKSIVTRSLKQGSKKLRSLLKQESKSLFHFKLIPFIIGLTLSALTLVPLIMQENMIWFIFFVVLAWINYQAYYFLTFYTQQGLKHRKAAERLRYTLTTPKKWSQQEFETYLPYAISLGIEDVLCTHFKRMCSHTPAPAKAFSAVWFVYDYPNYNLGEQLKKSLAYYK